MTQETLNNLTSSIKTKLGENASLIDDDIATLLTENQKDLNDMKSKEDEISTLKKDKEALMKVNGSLLQKVTVQINNQNDDNKDKEPEAKDFDFRTCFDEKGNFKN